MANDTPPVDEEPTPKGGLFGSEVDTNQAADANVRALLGGFPWATAFNGPQRATTISYSFPTSTTDYTSVQGGYPDAATQLAGFEAVTADQKNAVRTAFDLISSYTNL